MSERSRELVFLKIKDGSLIPLVCCISGGMVTAITVAHVCLASTKLEQLYIVKMEWQQCHLSSLVHSAIMP